MVEFEKIFSLYEQSLHSRSYLISVNLYKNMFWEKMFNFHVRIDIYSKVILNISEVPIFNPACSHMLKKKSQFAILLNYSMLEWFLTSWCLFCCQFLRGKLPNFYSSYSQTYRGWDCLISLFCHAVSFSGENTHFLIWAAKYLAQNSVTSKVTGTETIWLPISPVQHIE